MNRTMILTHTTIIITCSLSISVLFSVEPGAPIVEFIVALASVGLISGREEGKTSVVINENDKNKLIKLLYGRVRLGSIQNMNNWNNAESVIPKYLDFQFGYSAPRSRIAGIYMIPERTRP